MIELTSGVLVAAIVILTILSVVIGVQVVKILQELRLGMQKMNEILDDVANMTHSVSQPMVSLSGLVDSLKGGVKLVAVMKKLLGGGEEEENHDRDEDGHEDETGREAVYD